MSILHKGTLTVFVATVVASGMIVLTGNSAAEDKTKTNMGTTISSKQSDGIPKKLKKQADETAGKALTNSIPLAPPPGPFLSENAVVSAQKSLSAPVAPTAPVSLSKQPEQRANSLHFKAAPVLSKKVVEPKSDLNEPSTSTDSLIAPQLSQSAPQIDQKMKSISLSSQAPKQEAIQGVIVTPAPALPQTMAKQPKMKSTDLPIWIQEGNAIKQGLKPSSDSAPQRKQAVMGMPNMGWNNNYPAQQYIYVPVPMMPSNMAPPQMPMFNGNIIPPSKDWKAPVAPNNMQNIEMQKESTGGPSAPVQKGNK